MIKTDIFSGFLGAGKTTLIKKLADEAYKGEKLVIVENEFGEIGIDKGFLEDSGIEITEMNSGCICCTLVGDFTQALKKVAQELKPDRIIIEPSGVGKLSDVKEAAEQVEEIDIAAGVTVVDAKKCRMYMKNFGEFFNNQIENADIIVLSHTKGMAEDKLKEALHLIREHNDEAQIITTDWDSISGKQILDAMNECSHHHHDHDCECGCHDHEHEHHHHHEHEEHHHDEECGCHEHHHDHDNEAIHHHHDHDCECGCHDHEHHHHADEVFTSCGIETIHKFDEEEISDILDHIEETGTVLRAKGIVEAKDGSWLHFDYIPGEKDIRTGGAQLTGKACVIGTDLDEEKIRKMFVC